MGMYDTVMVPCPSCGTKYPAQSKSGRCVLEEFNLETAPPDVLLDVNRHAPFECQKCGIKFDVAYEAMVMHQHTRGWDEEPLKGTITPLPDSLVQQIKRLYLVSMSEDQHRVIARWLDKFIKGAVEHGKLDLNVNNLSRVLSLTTEEVQDLTSYVEMLLIQMEDMKALIDSIPALSDILQEGSNADEHREGRE